MYAYNVANGKKNVKCRRAKKDKISALWNENKKTREKRLPVAARLSEPLDIVATRNLSLVTIYVCRYRGRDKLRVSANRSTPSRRFSRVLTFFRNGCPDFRISNN